MLRYIYGLLVWFHVYARTAFAFEIIVPDTTVLVGQTAQFKWTWSDNDSKNQTFGVGLKLVQNDDNCPPNIDSGNSFFGHFRGEDGIVSLDLNVKDVSPGTDGSRHGTADFVAKQTGNFYLCAYSYHGRFENITHVATSELFTAKLSRGSIQVSPGEIVGVVIGSLSFILLLLGGFLWYRRVSFRRRLATFHRERMLLQQTPPSPFRVPQPDIQSQISGKRTTTTTETTSLAPLIQSPKRPHSHRRSIPLGYDDSMMKTYHFPPRDGASTSSETASLPSVALPSDPEKALTRS
ncbi:hypothetical protein VNI00_018172 [Paramarasmius palmivorus]|uniref:Uncharacterized protein n=1 Tax=Paramarasmius palmivorus TaxID=297713 RepID=A0AAW0AZV1_9AGAR